MIVFVIGKTLRHETAQARMKEIARVAIPLHYKPLVRHPAASYEADMGLYQQLKIVPNEEVFAQFLKALQSYTYQGLHFTVI